MRPSATAHRSSVPTVATLLTLSLAWGTAAGAESVVETAAPEVALEGRVLGGDAPLVAANVYAYEVGSLTLEKVLTDAAGSFLFRSLPAGLYKIIAVKDGFVPAVELLLRRAPDLNQFLEIRLAAASAAASEPTESYWTIRGRIPADVLRDLDGLGMPSPAADRAAPAALSLARFQTRMGALGGLEQLGTELGEAQVTGAEVGVDGELGGLEIGVRGRFQQLTPRDSTSPLAAVPGELRTLALSVARPQESTLRVATSSGELASLQGDQLSTVGLDHYQIHWSGRAGDGQSSLAATYLAESNYYQAGWVDPADVPEASRTWRLEGSYAREVGERTSIKAGLRYRQRTAQLDRPASLPPGQVDDESVGLYGIADSQIERRVLVEYGLFSTVRDGSLSLMPHGGLVVKLGDGWNARTSVAHRIRREEALPYLAFTSAYYSDRDACHEVADACYEVTLERGDEAGNSVSLGAVHREFGETLRMYFSRDFFDRLESLFMVRGDTLPEVQLSVVRRIAPKVLARLESDYAAGGGGVFYATDDVPYENNVRYLVTSLDTRFQQTSTGVFIAFHHLEQSLDPLQGRGEPGPGMELQRLQLMLTQDLDILHQAAAKWAVNLNMELSKGSNPYTLTADDELYRKLTGGFSVSF